MEDPDSMEALRIENEILRNRLKRHEFSPLKVASGNSSRHLAQNTNQSAVVLEKEKIRLQAELSLLRTNFREKDDSLAKQSVEFNEMKEEVAKAKDVLQHTGSIKYRNFNRMSCLASPFSNFFNAL
jgi:hypothetical protein